MRLQWGHFLARHFFRFSHALTPETPETPVLLPSPVTARHRARSCVRKSSVSKGVLVLEPATGPSSTLDPRRRPTAHNTLPDRTLLYPGIQRGKGGGGEGGPRKLEWRGCSRERTAVSGVPIPRLRRTGGIASPMFIIRRAGIGCETSPIWDSAPLYPHRAISHAYSRNDHERLYMLMYRSCRISMSHGMQ